MEVAFAASIRVAALQLVSVIRRSHFSLFILWAEIRRRTESMSFMKTAPGASGQGRTTAFSASKKTAGKWVFATSILTLRKARLSTPVLTRFLRIGVVLYG